MIRNRTIKQIITSHNILLNKTRAAYVTQILQMIYTITCSRIMIIAARIRKGEEIMVAQTVKVVNEQGLHMRPAGVFAKEMTKFSCAVTLDVAGKKINAKSVMLIIAACIKCGAEVTVECDGADEKEALAKAVELIESGFGE